MKKLTLSIMVPLLIVFCAFSIFFINPVSAKESSSSSIVPEVILYCPVYGANHHANTFTQAELLKFSDSSGDHSYRGTIYTCACGEEVFFTDDPVGTNIYLYNWTPHSTGIPGTLNYSHWIEPKPDNGALGYTNLDHVPYWDNAY